ncbi:MAG: hypothetical protein R3Y12_04175 [Clostridia bacterium]
MNNFIAKNPKQLDICLRFLYAEKVDFMVDVVENNKHKIEYDIKVELEQEAYDVLREKYRILTS